MRQIISTMLLPLALAAGPAAAAPVFAPFGNYSVEINPSSTGLTPLVGFNGSRADFDGFGVSNYRPANSTQVVETLSATFTANPGYVFQGAGIGVGQWSFSWTEGSGIAFNIQWSIPGAIYAGGSSANSPMPGCTNSGVDHWWTGSGSSGCSRFVAGFGPQGGGGFEYMSIMGGPMPILLADVQSFTVTVTADIWAGGQNAFGDGLTSGFGFSSLGITAFAVEGEPAPAAVPEPAGLALLAGALAALGTARRRRG